MQCTQCKTELIERDDGLLECTRCGCIFYELNNKIKKIDINYSNTL